MLQKSFHHYAGAPMRMRLGEPNVREEYILGPDLKSGQSPQIIVPRGTWQSSESLGAWSLVGCMDLLRESGERFVFYAIIRCSFSNWMGLL